ncbi:MAG: hypothetical protein ACFFDK_18080 [Promethearchaeota archaeon]
MDLNWSPEVILDIFVAISFFIISILTYEIPSRKKIKSLFYIRLGFISIALFFMFEGLSFVFMSIFLHQIHSLIILFTAFFFFIGINYTLRESSLSLNLLPLLLLTIPYIYLMFLPGMIIYSIEFGYPTIVWTGLLNITGIIIQAITAFFIFYWGLKTYVNSPFLIKREARIFFIGTLLCTIGAFSIYMLTIWIPISILLSDIFIVIGAVIFTVAIIREPKLLYILPFTIYRILVKDKEGFPLFDHDWSESDISEITFTGFINAVQLMSEEVLAIGGVVDIHLEEGILTLHKSELITVGLVASKSSKLLRESLVNFSNDFQKRFERELKNSVKDMDKYDAAYELIEKYFSNFPYRIITSKNYPLILSGKYADIPLELENKLKQFITNKKEYETILTELIKYPMCVSEEFLNFYREIKEEPEKLPEDEYKYLDSEFDDESSV